MIARELIAKIQKFKGPIYTEVANFDDVFYVQIVKSDLVAMIRSAFGANLAERLENECGFELDDHGYFGKDFDSEL